MIGKLLRKIIQQLLLMFCILKKWKYVWNMSLLMIPNGKGWCHLAIKKLSVLLRGITLKYNGDFCCLNCLHSFRTENKL